MGLENWNTLEELQGLLQTGQPTKDPRELYEMINDKLDKSIYYGEDRVKQIEDDLNQNYYADAVSSEGFRMQQVKATSKNLSDKTPMTQHLDRLADYILYSHYDNPEQEKEFHEAQEEFNRLTEKRAKKKTEQDKKQLLELRNKIQSKPKRQVKKVWDNQYGSTENTYSIEKFFEESGDYNYDSIPNFKVNYTTIDKDLNQSNGRFRNSQRYWIHFAPPKGHIIRLYKGETEPYAVSAYETIKQLQETLESVQVPLEEIKVPINLEIQELNRTGKESSEALKELRNQERKLRKVRNEISEDYNLAVNELKKVTELKGTSISSGETIPNDAWLRLSLRNTDTYLALLEGYSELKVNYQNKISTTMWALLRDFEELYPKARLDETEQYIMETMLSDGRKTAKAISQEILEELNKEVPERTIQNILTKIIPKRIQEVYEQELEDWVWTFRRKGTYKTCKKCGEVKLVKHFSIQNTYKDGVSNTCKKCESKRVKRGKTT